MVIGTKIPATLHFTNTEKVLMVMLEVDIGLIPDPITPIILLILVDCWVFLFMFMREVGIGLIPGNFLHKTMVDYILSTQCYPKNLYQGVWKYIWHIKIITIILIQLWHPTLIQACHHTLIKKFHHILIQ